MRGNPGGRDWNGNGKRDSFDRFIDYKASSNVASNNKTNTQPSEQKGTPQNDGAVIFKSLQSACVSQVLHCRYLQIWDPSVQQFVCFLRLQLAHCYGANSQYAAPEGIRSGIKDLFY